MDEDKRPTKIDAAIAEMKARLKNANTEVLLMTRERDVLLKELGSLESIRDSKHFK